MSFSETAEPTSDLIANCSQEWGSYPSSPSSSPLPSSSFDNYLVPSDQLNWVKYSFDCSASFLPNSVKQINILTNSRISARYRSAVCTESRRGEKKQDDPFYSTKLLDQPCLVHLFLNFRKTPSSDQTSKAWTLKSTEWSENGCLASSVTHFDQWLSLCILFRPQTSDSSRIRQLLSEILRTGVQFF